LSCINCGRILGTICQDNPYLSLSHPHCDSLPPLAVSFAH
jgi:hypothetical protein